MLSDFVMWQPREYYGNYDRSHFLNWLKRLFLVLVFFYLGATPSIFAAVEVAFLQMYDRHGKLIQLDESGPGYFHVALKYQGRWLHAHPRGGVQISDSLKEFGVLMEILEHPDLLEPTEQDVAAYIGRSYNSSFSWNGDGFYCSQLVGLFLRIDPRPMRFHGPYWTRYFRVLGIKPPRGPGISPDYIHEKLLSRGFVTRRPGVHCEGGLLP